MSLEVVGVKGPSQPASLWDYGGINTPHPRAVLCPVDAHRQAVLLEMLGSLSRALGWSLRNCTWTFQIPIS